MKCFKSLEAVALVPLSANIRRAVTRSMRNLLDVHGDVYDPETDGCVVMFEESSTDDDARLLFGRTWADAPLEGVSYDRETETFLAVVLLNNQLGFSIIVPDAPWLPSDFRANLLENLCVEGPP